MENNYDGELILATDLDGTLIPLDHSERNREDLCRLRTEFDSGILQIVFVTGRHLDSVRRAIVEYELPEAEWIICDVGTSIYRRNGGDYQQLEPYQHHLSGLTGSWTPSSLCRLLDEIEGLRIQETEKQGRFKLSFYADAFRLPGIVESVQNALDAHDAAYGIIHSVDPFNGDGLIDLLPKCVTKAYAIQWWTRFVGVDEKSIAFAGDSGNDFAALTAGNLAILVGNADRTLARQVRDAHSAAGWENRLHLASEEATSGVLEGYRYFSNLVAR